MAEELGVSSTDRCDNLFQEFYDLFRRTTDVLVRVQVEERHEVEAGEGRIAAEKVGERICLSELKLRRRGVAVLADAFVQRLPIAATRLGRSLPHSRATRSGTLPTRHS